MAQSKIEWTDVTWNPTTGCTKISRRMQALLRGDNGSSSAVHGL